MSRSFAECRAAAAAVRRSPHVRQVIDTVRPPSGVGAFRGRAPLAFTLWTASRDDLLVWRDVDAFALVEPYGPVRPGTFDGGLRYGLVRFVDRNWNVVATHTPTALLLIAGVALLPWPPATLFCVLAMVGWVVLVMLAGLLRPLVRAVRRGPKTSDELVAESPTAQWSVALLHATDPARVPDLLRAVEAEVRAHVRVASREAHERLSTEFAGGGSRPPAIVLRVTGITTDEARKAAGTADSDVLLRADGHLPPRQLVIGVNFLLLYAFGTALAIVVCALVMAGPERDACTPDCAGRPATFASALRLLVQRLWLRDPPDLHPGTLPGVAIAWLVSLLTPVTVLVAGVAVRQTIRRDRDARVAFEQRRIARSSAKTVIFTALEVEYKEAVRYLTDRTSLVEAGTRYEIGERHGRRIAIVQTGAGNGRAALEVERARARFHPEVMIFVGVAGGRKDVERGDVVAADTVYDYESGKDAADGLRTRFKTYHSSHQLVQCAQQVARTATWQLALDTRPRAFVKPLAAGGKIVADNMSYTGRLITQNAGDAVAVEMEGHGFLQGVHASAGTDAIVIRGISDRLNDKTPDSDETWQPIAARNAAAFAFALLDELDIG